MSSEHAVGPDSSLSARDGPLKTLLLASPAERFSSIFRRYFSAAGYLVKLAREPSSVRVALQCGDLGVFVLDAALADGDSRNRWRETAKDVRARGVAVLGAAPMDEADVLREEVASWADDIITYPMNPESVLRKIEALLWTSPRGRERDSASCPRPPASALKVEPALTAPPPGSVQPGSPRPPLMCSLEASRAILDQVADAIFVFTRVGEVTMVNDAACRMLGYDREDLLGRSAGVVFSQLEYLPSVNGLHIRQAMSHFAVPAFDTMLKTASGHAVPVSFGMSFLRDDDGAVTGILGIARDIRERRALEEHMRRYSEILEEEVISRTAEIRASEKKYRALVDQLPSAVVCADPEGRVVSFNRKARRSFGWDDAVIGTTVYKTWGCQDCESPESCHEAIAKRRVWVGECIMTRGNGATATMLHTFSLLRDDAGRSTGAVHVLTDLSEPVGPERELLRDAQGLVVCDQKGHRKIVARSDKMAQVLGLVAACANSSARVLIDGESGVGKDLVAEALHLNSDRAHGPYVVVNCATLQEEFLKSELFGHERGAFTGAVRSRQGLLEAADGGTLFIDEVADMSPAVQAMMLRVIEAGRFRRMGATEEKQVDVRIIAATNKTLEKEVAAGRFRADLFYRLTGIRISLPPLRERLEDVPVLVKHFLATSRDFGKEACPKRVSEKAMKTLMSHSWPGNVRELENVIEQARILSRGSAYITERHLPQQIVGGAGSDGAEQNDWASLADVGREHIRRILKSTGGNRTRAARILDISRATLIKKIRKHRL